MADITVPHDDPGSPPLVSEESYHKLVDWEIFGKVVKSLRTKRGLSQKQLGDLCNIRDSYISQIESGIKDNVSIKVINDLASNLGTYPKWIMYLSSTPDEDPRVSELHWKIVRLVMEQLNMPDLQELYQRKYNVKLYRKSGKSGDSQSIA